jgi:multidrug transporter EmrE-like cation transporter
MQASLASRQGPVALALAIGKSPVILAGLTCFGFSAVVWLFVLARIPLSSAYPFVALGIVITVVAGHLLFAEQISLVKIVGVASILAGIGLVAISR